MSNGISRRNFLKGATGGAAVLAALNMVGCSANGGSTSASASAASPARTLQPPRTKT